MKRVLIIFICLGFYASTSAQQIERGGFGYFMSGPAFVLSSKVDNYLSTEDVLGPSYKAPTISVGAGGEGFAILGRVIIGGGGFGLSQFVQHCDSASLTQSGGWGYFKTGYIVWSKKYSFMSANIGVGGFGYNYEIRNDIAKNGIYFNKEFPILIGEQRKYSYGGTCFDFSYGIKTLVINKEKDRDGGFLFVFDAGVLLSIATGDWQGDDEKIMGPPSPGISSTPYIRILIGGGGVNVSEGQ